MTSYLSSSEHTIHSPLLSAKTFLVQEVLRSWDPIGIQPGTIAPFDEYDSYALAALSTLESKQCTYELAKKLDYFRTSCMGLGSCFSVELFYAETIADVLRKSHFIDIPAIYLDTYQHNLFSLFDTLSSNNEPDITSFDSYLPGALNWLMNDFLKRVGTKSGSWFDGVVLQNFSVEQPRLFAVDDDARLIIVDGYAWLDRKNFQGKIPIQASFALTSEKSPSSLEFIVVLLHDSKFDSLPFRFSLQDSTVFCALRSERTKN